LILLQNDPIKLGKGQYGCPFCNSVKKKANEMIRHIRTHTGEKPFICNYCNHACAVKGNLTTHIKKYHL